MASVVELLQPLGLGLVGGVLAPYVLSGRERRATRATTAAALREVEIARQSGGDAVFRRALAGFSAAALVAGLPEPVVRRYERLSTVAHSVAVADYAAHPEDEGGWLPHRLVELLRDSAGLVVRHAWSPWRARWGQRRAVRRLDEHVEQLRQSDAWSHVAQYAWEQS